MITQSFKTKFKVKDAPPSGVLTERFPGAFLQLSRSFLEVYPNFAFSWTPVSVRGLDYTDTSLHREKAVKFEARLLDVLMTIAHLATRFRIPTLSSWSSCFSITLLDSGSKYLTGTSPVTPVGLAVSFCTYALQFGRNAFRCNASHGIVTRRTKAKTHTLPGKHLVGSRTSWDANHLPHLTIST